MKKLFNWFNKLEYNEQELLIKEVIEKIINNPSSDFKILPISHDILIYDPENQYYLLINGTRIKISNHEFSLEKSVRVSFAEDMRNMVFTKIEEDRKKLIEEIFQNEVNLLNKIKNSL